MERGHCETVVARWWHSEAVAARRQTTTAWQWPRGSGSKVAAARRCGSETAATRQQRGGVTEALQDVPVLETNGLFSLRAFQDPKFKHRFIFESHRNSCYWVEDPDPRVFL